MVLLGAPSTRLPVCRARFLALLVHPAAVFTPRSARVSPSAIAVSLRRVQGLHQVGSGHRLELTACRLASFAHVDRLRQRQIAHLQQLVLSGLVAILTRIVDSTTVPNSHDSRDGIGISPHLPAIAQHFLIDSPLGTPPACDWPADDD